MGNAARSTSFSNMPAQRGEKASEGGGEGGGGGHAQVGG